MDVVTFGWLNETKKLRSTRRLKSACGCMGPCSERIVLKLDELSAVAVVGNHPRVRQRAAAYRCHSDSNSLNSRSARRTRKVVPGTASSLRVDRELFLGTLFAEFDHAMTVTWED